MQIESIWVSQRQLRNVAQVVSMQISLSRGNPLPPVTIAYCEDDSYQLEDGHHRLVAYWLSSQKVLQPHQYFLVQKDSWKPRFGQFDKLLDRVRDAVCSPTKSQSN